MGRIKVQTAGIEKQGTKLSGPATAARKPGMGNNRNRMLALAALVLAGTAARAQFGTQPVGAISGAQGVTVTAQTAGTVNSVEVLTLGTARLEFAQGTGASTCGTASFSASGQTCTESVTFTPAVPGLRLGAIVLLDGSGNPLGIAYLSGIGSGGLGVLVPGNVIPVAGDGDYLGSVEDGQPALLAELNQPTSVALDGAGNMYIADSIHDRIRMVCSSATSATIKGTTCAGAGIISTIAGDGHPAYMGDNGAASAATVSDPTGVAVDGAGNLYIADTGNSAIRMISAATGVITTVAGNGSGCAGQTDTVGDGCPAISAQLNLPEGVTVSGNGNFYIADTGNHRIRMVAASTGIITTVAGNGFTNGNGSGGFSGDNGPATAARLNYPHTVAFDTAGNMYIPDLGNNIIREVAAVGGVITPASIITSFAGNGTPGNSGDGAAASLASLWGPSGVAVDAAGNVYIADTQNNSIRKVSASNLFISTLAQNFTTTFYFNNAFYPLTFYGPTGLWLDGRGNLYIADTLDMVIQEAQGNFIALDYPTVRQNSKSAPMSQTVENDGNAALDLTAITPDNNSALDAATTTCRAGNPFLAVAADCTIGAVFAPTVAGASIIANIDVGKPADTADSPLDIQLIGAASAVNSTTITVTSSPNPSGFGQSVTFTATVSTGAGTGNLTGTVSFLDGATILSTDVPVGATTTVGTNSTAVATISTTTLAVGPHAITVIYDNSNDLSHSTSTSGVLTQTVLEGTATSLTSNQNPSFIGQNVTFTATVTAPSGGGVIPDGTITFFDGNTILVNKTLDATGAATYSTAALTVGAHSITATYGGDAKNDIQGSASAVLIQDVQKASTNALTSSPNPSNYGSPVTFTSTITSGGNVAATGTVNFLDGATIIGAGTLAGNPGVATFTTSTLSVGTHTITSTYPGDASNSASNSGTLSQVVNQAQTATSTSAVPSPAIAGAPLAITATVKVTAGVSNPTGTVTFTSGSTVLGSAPLAVSGSATISATLSVGPYSIVATYGGDTNDASSASAPLALTVAQATTLTSVTVTPNPAIAETTVTFTAKVTGNGGSPGGTVVFSANGTAIGTPATLDATGTATATTSGFVPGSYAITAVYGGDTNDQGSTGTGTAPLVVGTIPTTTDLGNASTSGQNPQVILVAAVLSGSGPVATGTVTFNNGTTAVGTATLDSAGVAALTPNLAIGSFTIVAVYSGDALHSPSTSQPVTVSAGGTTFSLIVTPPTVTMKTSQNDTVTVTLSSNGGFADTIGLGCSSLPAGVTCHFAPASAALAANGTVTDQLTIDTNNPLSGGSSAMNARGGSRGTYLAGILLPFSLFFGWVFWRFRKRHTGLLTVVLVTVLSAAALLATGCSGFSMGSTAPGTYVIQVTGTGVNSNISHYQNLTLTLTN